MAFRSVLTNKSVAKVKTHHRKSKSIDFNYSKLVDVPADHEREAHGIVSDPALSKSANALWTPPRSKAHKITKAAKKDKKKQKIPKLNSKDSVPQLEMSAVELKRQRSISSPMQVALKYAGSPNMPVTKEDSVDGKTSPVLSTDGSQQGELKNMATSEPLADDRSGQVMISEKRQSFSRGFHRSFSLDDMLSDDRVLDNEHSEANGKTKELESLHQSRKTAYQRFISHQEDIKRGTRRGHNKERAIHDDTHARPPRRGRLDISMSISHRWIQRSRNIEDLLELLESKKDVNTKDHLTGNALIHIIMKKKRKQERLEFLLALPIHGKVDVNLQNAKGEAALHMAVEDGDEMCAKALVVFGADVNVEGRNCFTPMDLAIDNGTIPNIEDMLINLRAKSSNQLIKRVDSQVLQHHIHRKIRHKSPAQGVRTTTNDRLVDFVNRKNMLRLCRELEANINQRLSFSASIGGDDDNTVLVMQQREVALFNKTLRKSGIYSAAIEFEEGSRVLCLDGGGIKGLIQIEVLIQIEEKTKRKITELFDWIVGTSTGGIIALALVYGGKSLSELRQLYFRIKDEIFAKGRYGFGWDSDAYEELLQQYLDPKMKLMDVKHPRVLIAAVNKATTNLELNFFNNCLEDEFCDYPVWKVARYTSAAPMFLKECDNYVDGGVICNNPTDCGLTVIQNFYRKQGMKAPIALVVSVGSGRYPPEKIGKVDAQAFLYFGKRWLQIDKLVKRTQNLLTLLNQALVETEKVAENSKSRCEEQDIPFYRFNPSLKEIIPAGETDNEKLLDMIIEAKIQIREQGLNEMTELLQMLTINSTNTTDASRSVNNTPSNSAALLPTKDSSYVVRSSPPPSPPTVTAATDQEQLFNNQQVPRFTITSESGEEEESEDGHANDRYNDQLNKSMVSPAEATEGGDGRLASTGMDFSESVNAKEEVEIDSGELSHKHYQLKVDNHNQQSHQHQP